MSNSRFSPPTLMAHFISTCVSLLVSRSVCLRPLQRTDSWHRAMEFQSLTHSLPQVSCNAIQSIQRHYFDCCPPFIANVQNTFIAKPNYPLNFVPPAFSSSTSPAQKVRGEGSCAHRCHINRRATTIHTTTYEQFYDPLLPSQSHPKVIPLGSPTYCCSHAARTGSPLGRSR